MRETKDAWKSEEWPHIIIIIINKSDLTQQQNFAFAHNVVQTLPLYYSCV